MNYSGNKKPHIFARALRKQGRDCLSYFNTSYQGNISYLERKVSSQSFVFLEIFLNRFIQQFPCQLSFLYSKCPQPSPDNHINGNPDLCPLYNVNLFLFFNSLFYLYQFCLFAALFDHGFSPFRLIPDPLNLLADAFIGHIGIKKGRLNRNVP